MSVNVPRIIRLAVAQACDGDCGFLMPAGATAYENPTGERFCLLTEAMMADVLFGSGGCRGNSPPPRGLLNSFTDTPE